MMARKKKSRLPYWLSILVVIVLAVGGDKLKSMLGLETDQEIIETSAERADMGRLEIPAMTKGKQGQIIQRTGYTLAYDAKNKTPQWVAWELTKEETRGNEERTNEFLPDPDVTGAKVVTYDYSGSGYDRGHMAPEGDMKWDKQAMKESSGKSARRFLQGHPHRLRKEKLCLGILFRKRSGRTSSERVPDAGKTHRTDDGHRLLPRPSRRTREQARNRNPYPTPLRLQGI